MWTLYTWITRLIFVAIGGNLDRLEMERSPFGLARLSWRTRARLLVGIMATWQRCTLAARLQGQVYLSVAVLVLATSVISVAGLWRSVITHKQLSGYLLASVFASLPSSMSVRL